MSTENTTETRQPDGLAQADGSLPDEDSEWICEHCKKVVRFGDTHLSWCLNIICEDCAEKYREEENTELTTRATAQESTPPND